MSILLSLALSGVFIAQGVPQVKQGTRDFTSAQQLSNQQMLEAVNRARSQPRQCGWRYFSAAPPLHWNATLAHTAHKQATDMAKNDYIKHRNSDGVRITKSVKQAGYHYYKFGENLAAGPESLEYVMEGWLNSPPHCANIMNPKFIEFGMANASNDNSTYQIYWVQHFGRPK